MNGTYNKINTIFEDLSVHRLVFSRFFKIKCFLCVFMAQHRLASDVHVMTLFLDSRLSIRRWHNAFYRTLLMILLFEFYLHLLRYIYFNYSSNNVNLTDEKHFYSISLHIRSTY